MSIALEPTRDEAGFSAGRKIHERTADGLLPRILPPGVEFMTIPHNGKSDLQKSIPGKLNGWQYPGDRFVIVHEQDSNDCIQLKEDLLTLCGKHRPNVLVRIACRELESWYFGDLTAVSKAYGRDYTTLAKRRGYRIPDRIGNPKDELRKHVDGHQQIRGARMISQYMDIESNTSASFRVFVDGVRRLCQ